MKKRPVLLCVVLSAFALSSCQHASTHQQEHVGSVSIMTFNVENLFDAKHDQGKNDETYLSIEKKQTEAHKRKCQKVPVKKWRKQCLHWDWSERIVDYKLARTAEVIRQSNDGAGADIIAFQEVENLAILKRLNDDYLADLNYTTVVLLEGHDLRGIDVAFLSRYPLAAPAHLHEIEFVDIEERRKGDTRGILQADFMLPDGSVITGFAVHFPAPFHPFALRIDAYNSLNKLVEKLPTDRVAFAAGDFNTPSAEDREHQLLDTYAAPFWHVAHQVQCQRCPGTHYYAPKQEWSFLDMILVRRMSAVENRERSWHLNPTETRLINGAAEQRTPSGRPKSFDIAGPSGVSDHWPLQIMLKKHAE